MHADLPNPSPAEPSAAVASDATPMIGTRQENILRVVAVVLGILLGAIVAVFIGLFMGWIPIC